MEIKLVVACALINEQGKVLINKEAQLEKIMGYWEFPVEKWKKTKHHKKLLFVS